MILNLKSATGKYLWYCYVGTELTLERVFILTSQVEYWHDSKPERVLRPAGWNCYETNYHFHYYKWQALLAVKFPNFYRRFWKLYYKVIDYKIK